MKKFTCRAPFLGVEMNYILFVPKEVKETLPLIVYLHGAGERGNNAEHLFRHAIPKMIKEGAEIPALVLCPQCPENCVWDNIVFPLKALIDGVVTEYRADHERITLTGSSMGGFGAWMAGLTFGGFFAGIAPVAGGSHSWRVGNLKSTPVYAVHGALDTDVPPIYTQLMVDSLLAQGGNVTFVSLPNAGHNDGIDQAYRNTELIDWLLRQRRTDFTPPTEVLAEYF